MIEEGESSDEHPAGFGAPPPYLGSDPEHPSAWPVRPSRSKAQLLPFDQLVPRDFERLCYRLVIREVSKISCHLYGVPGEKQNGIDLIGIKQAQPVQRQSYYQCKNMQDFSGSDLKKAVCKFLEGSFAADASEFTLVVRAPSKINLIDEFLKQRSLLAVRQIEFELWTVEELSEKLELLPQVVEKFFGPDWANEFCMGSLPLVEQSMLATLVEAARADPVLATGGRKSTGFEPGRSQSVYGDHFNFFQITNEEVIIYSNLPTGRAPLGNCLILFRQQSASAVQITLNHVDMIGSLFPGYGSGASEHRGFFAYRNCGEHPSVVIDLAGVRLTISEVAYDHFCEAVDGLFKVFEDSLMELDRRWETEGYQFAKLDKGRTVIRLGSMPYWVWDKVVQLADKSEGSALRDNLFRLSASTHFLHVRTDTPTSTIDAGHHLSIWRGTIEDIETWNGTPSLWVSLYWEPPERDFSASTEARGMRAYWGCETTVNWIKSELLPVCFTDAALGKAGLLRRFLTRRRAEKLSFTRQNLDYLFYVERKFMLLPLPATFTANFLISFLEQLWSFANYVSQQKYFDANVMLSVYAAARFALKYVKLGYLGYVVSKLDLDATSIKDEHDIVSEIKRKAGELEHVKVVSSGLVDYGIRALKEIVKRGQNTLNEAELRKMAEFLEPLAAQRDEGIRMQLHTPKSI